MENIFFAAFCSSFKNLEVLDLSFNNFNHIDIGSALIGFSSLNSLNLIYNQLSWRSIYSMPLYTFHIIEIFIICLFFIIKYIQLSIIGICIWLDISNLSSLEELHLEGNDLNESHESVLRPLKGWVVINI